MTKSLKDIFDNAAVKAKELAEKAGHAVKDAVGKVVDVTKNTPDKVKHAGDHAGNKLGA